MKQPYDIKLKKAPSTVWDDKSKMHLCSSDKCPLNRKLKAFSDPDKDGEPLFVHYFGL